MVSHDFVPGIWRFHAIYLCVTGVLALCFFPYALYISLFFIASACAMGIVLTASKRLLASHILALAIGLGTPVVVMGNFLPYQSIAFFGLLIGSIAGARKLLF